MDSNWIYIYIYILYMENSKISTKNHQYATYIDDFYYSGIHENMIVPRL